MKFKVLIIFSGFLLCVGSQASSPPVQFQNITMKDGTRLQVCIRYPDSKKFRGLRPALMIIPGSSRYDTCRALEKPYSESLAEKGIIVFARQKRGLSRNLVDGSLEVNAEVYKQADLNRLKTDTLEAFEFLQNNPSVNPDKCALFGGSEGTILSTYIAQRHPELREVTLAGSMIEEFESLFERQFYGILPKELIRSLDKNLDNLLVREEIDEFSFEKFGLNSFEKIDRNDDGALSEIEVSIEIRRVVAYSVTYEDDTFFLSDPGGQIPLGWYLSALKLKDLGPQILRLRMPVYLHHGTKDMNTTVEPVRKLQSKAENRKLENFIFQFYDGLDHQLSLEVINQIYQGIGHRLTADDSTSQ